MMNRKTFCRMVATVTMAFLYTAALAWHEGGGGGGGTLDTERFDTSFAVEYSYSCLSGGCHEQNTTLLNEYSQSFMTHAMVKCNTCHGTHTAAELGKPKPNLAGYTSSSGATGYKIPKDRCLACHTAVLTQSMHPKNPSECKSCHQPHVFKAR